MNILPLISNTWVSGTKTPSKDMLDVLLPSAYFCDLVFTGLREMPRLGAEIFSERFEILPGGGFIPAVALTRLGLRVDWACDFGNDFFSRYVLEEARRQSLSPRLFRMHDRPLQAVTVAYSFAQDRALLSYMDPTPPIDLSALLRENPARCLLLMWMHSGTEFMETAHAAHARGSIVFMDGQVAGNRRLADPEVVLALQTVDIFTLNEKEALQLTGEQTTQSALNRLAELTPTVIIKLGADGAIARNKNQQIHMPGVPTGVADTTGAGDNFDCGFLYGILQGYSLEDCLRCGNFCASRSITAQGGWEASPIAREVQSYLETTKG